MLWWCQAGANNWKEVLSGGQEQESEEGGMKFPAIFVWCARVEGQSRAGVCGHRAALGCWCKSGEQPWGAGGCGGAVLVSCLMFVLCETAAWE